MYYTSSHWVNWLASWQNEEREGNYTHDLHCSYIHCFPKDTLYMPASHIALFSCIAINIISMFNVLFELAACLVCASLSVYVGDGGEWDQQCVWHSELLSGLDKVDVCMEQLQQEQEKWITQGGDWTTSLQAMVRIMALWSALLVL